eukprot:COSAG02_NODE_15701_length_1147_cov_5.399809_1_plen_39_part_00
MTGADFKELNELKLESERLMAMLSAAKVAPSETALRML